MSTTVILQQCLDRLKQGDESARAELLERAQRRLLELARRMLGKFPRVARWEQFEDVNQQACIRLHRALKTITPETTLHFLRLAATQLRRELRDLARHYYGPEGIGFNHGSQTQMMRTHNSSYGLLEGAVTLEAAKDASVWTELHEVIDRLPEKQREAFDLLWYHELSQAEAAEILGVSVRQVKRYWLAARLALQKELTHDDLESQ